MSVIQKGTTQMRNRKPVRTIAAVGIGALGLSFGLMLPADAGLTTTCEGVAADVTVPNDLVVAKDSSCDLTNVVIEGDVTVRAGANLYADGVKITGKLSAQKDGFVDLTETSVDGDLVLAKAYGAFTSAGTVGGNTISRQAGFLYSEENEHKGDLRSNGGATYLTSSVVAKQVATNGDLVSDLDDTWVQGNLSVRNAELGTVICGSEVDGNGILRGNGGTVNLGLDSSGEDCNSVYVGGNLRVSENTADTVISNSIVRGQLNCLDNDPAPVGENNRVRGKMLNQCEDLAAPTAETDRSVDTLAAKVETHEQQTLDQIEKRRAAAHEQAVQLGAAAIG